MVREAGHPQGWEAAMNFCPSVVSIRALQGESDFYPQLMEHLRGDLPRIQKTREKSKSPNLGRQVEKQVPLTAKPRANIPFLPAFTITHLKTLQNNNIPALVPVCLARKSDA